MSIESNKIIMTSTGGLSTIKNPEEFFGGYSKPINTEPMRIYKDMELVEQLGSGMDRILGYYQKESFVLEEEFLKNIFISDHDAIQNEGVNEGENEGVNEGVNSLYDYILSNPNSKTSQIAKYLNKPMKTIERWVAQLRQEDKIEFKGSFKTGGYFVANHIQNGGVNEGVNEGVKNLYSQIQKAPNSKTMQLAKYLNTSPKTIERWLKQLKDEDKIEFKGSFKTGGYFAIQNTNKGLK